MPVQKSKAIRVEERPENLEEYWQRAEVSDYLSRMSGKTVSPEKVSAWCKSGKYTSIIFEGRYYMHDSVVLYILNRIRSGTELGYERTSKEEFLMLKIDQFRPVRMEEWRIQDEVLNEEFTPPMQIADYIERCQNGSIPGSVDFFGSTTLRGVYPA